MKKKIKIYIGCLVGLILPNYNHTHYVPNPKKDPLRCYTFKKSIYKEDIYKKSFINHETEFIRSHCQGGVIFPNSLLRQGNLNSKHGKESQTYQIDEPPPGDYASLKPLRRYLLCKRCFIFNKTSSGRR